LNQAKKIVQSLTQIAVTKFMFLKTFQGSTDYKNVLTIETKVHKKNKTEQEEKSRKLLSKIRKFRKVSKLKLDKQRFRISNSRDN
jgi:hypothetical protein